MIFSKELSIRLPQWKFNTLDNFILFLYQLMQSCKESQVLKHFIKGALLLLLLNIPLLIIT